MFLSLGNITNTIDTESGVSMLIQYLLSVNSEITVICSLLVYTVGDIWYFCGSRFVISHTAIVFVHGQCSGRDFIRLVNPRLC